MLFNGKLNKITLAACLAFSAAAGAQVGSVAPSQAINTNGVDPFRMLLQTNPGAYINCGQTGECSFATPTRSHMAIISWLRSTQEVTRQRYEDLVKRTVDDLNDIVKSVYASNQSSGGQPEGLMSLSYRSKSEGSLVEVTKLYQAFADFQQRELLITQDLALLSSFFNGEDSGIDIKDKGFITTNVPLYAKTSTKALDNGFWNSIKAVNKLVCNASFNLKFQTGASLPLLNATPIACDETASNVSIQIENDGVLLSNDEIVDIKNKIKALKRPPQETVNAAQKMFTEVRKLVETFVEVWGLDQSRSFSNQGILDRLAGALDSRVNKGIQGRIQQRQESYDRLIDIMWLRSALRLSWGLPLGAFDVHYVKDKGWGGTKALFMTRYETLTEIPQAPIFDQDPIEAALERASSGYFEALNTTESKSLEILNGDSSLLDKVNEGIALYKGDENTWKALNMVIKLLAADFYEERALWQQGGLQKVNALYAARFVNVDKDTRKRFTDLKENFQNVILGLGADTPSGNDLEDVNFAKDNSIRGSASDLSLELQQWTSNISQVRALQIQLNVAQQTKKLIEMKKVQNRVQNRL